MSQLTPKRFESKLFSSEERSRCTVLVIPEDKLLDRFWGTACQLTLGGMFILAPHRLPLGALVQLKLVPRDHPPIRVRATIVSWSKGLGCSCAFLPDASTSRESLARLLGRSGGLSPVSGIIGA
jgi:hypothetical protein